MTNEKTKGGERMKIKVELDRIESRYNVVVFMDNFDETLLEQVVYATNADKKRWPANLPACMFNKDEARIYAKQRAEFYNSRITK
jgi:hypothetical protein